VPAEQVRRIRARASVAMWLRELLKHQPTLEEIAASEGVTLRTVRSIVSGQRYQWVGEEP
jgi:predicted transcriptional regulator